MKNTINPAVAFDHAIAEGRLSDDPESTEFAGRYMYMYSVNLLRDTHTAIGWRHAFKHKRTREYLFADCIHPE
jgi:hypothetical protein